MNYPAAVRFTPFRLILPADKELRHPGRLARSWLES